MPSISFDASSDTVDGRYTSMRVVVRATTPSTPGNRLTRLELTSVRNGWIELGGARLAVPSVVALTGTELSFVLHRRDLNAPFQADYVVSDSCGDVSRFVGSGQGPLPAAIPTVTVVPTPTPTAQPSPGPTSLPAAQVAIGVYRPAYPNNLSSVVEYEQATGKKMTIVHWYALWGGWKSAFSASDLDAVTRRGSVPMITWEPWAGQARDPAWSLRDAILSGRNDAYIDSWARGMAAYGRPVLLRFAHEMHAQSYPWAVGVNGNTDAEYVAAWRHVHGFFERAGASNVKWVWNPNTLWGGSAPAADHLARWQRLYPGDAYVDWTGLDLYNTGPSLDWGAPYWRSFENVLGEPYSAMSTLAQKPILLGEVGSTEIGGDKAAWIADGLSQGTLARYSNVRAVVWFDIDKSQEQNWAIRSSSGAYSAFVAALRQSHFMADASALIPLILAERRIPASTTE
jgi:beta-mannanase